MIDMKCSEDNRDRDFSIANVEVRIEASVDLTRKTIRSIYVHCVFNKLTIGLSADKRIFTQ